MSKKKKFDLTDLVRHNRLKDGESVYFVSDPSKTAIVSKQPNGEFKLKVGKETMTVHACSTMFLGTECPDHASRWLRNSGGKTLYEIWQMDLAEAA
jgi:hypothetical protein